MSIDPLSGGFVAGYAVLLVLWTFTLIVSAMRMRATRTTHEAISRLYLVLLVGSIAAILACGNNLSRVVANFSASGAARIEPAKLVGSMMLPYCANAVALIAALCYAVRGWLPRIEREEDGQLRVKQELENMVSSRTAELKATIDALEEDRQKREAVERQLRAEHAKLEAIMQTSAGAIMVVNSEGRIVFANAQAEKVLGVTVSEATRRTYDAEEWRSADLEGRPVADQDMPFRRVLEAGEPVYNMQVSIGWPDGSRRILEVNGAPLPDNGDGGGVVFLVTDITQRVHDEEVLRNSEKRFRHMVEDLPMGAVFVEGDHIRPNRAAEEITGYTRDELTTIDQWFWALYRTGSADARAKYGAFQDAGFIEVCTGTIIRKDGAERVIECGGYKSGNAIVWLLHDVTEKHQSKAERHRFQSHLLATQSLENLAVMALGVANDCNNILTGILGTADLARHELAQRDVARPYIEEIAAGAERAADLCTMMMAYTGGVQLHSDSADINAAVQEMMRFTRGVDVDASTTPVTFDLDNSAPAVRADGAQIRKVLVAVLRNAAEAIKETNGSITISTKSIRIGESLTGDARAYDGLSPGEYVCVSIKDTGRGMNPNTLAKAFDPLFTTKPNARGLGLTYSLGIARASSGNIRIDSKEGQGTTVSLYLPAAYASTISEVEPVKSDVIWHGTGTILVVDDEENVRAVTKRMLERLGFDVLLAREAREALTFVEERKDIAAVILDLSMPDMDGRRALVELRRVCPGVPVLIASGYDMKLVTKRFPEGDAAGFIQKPFSLTSLSTHLRMTLAAPAGPRPS